MFVSLRKQAQVYRANRTKTGWSKPEKLPAEVNIGPSIWKPSIAADGTIYFVSIDTKGGKRLYAAARKGDGYAAAQPLSFSDGTTADVDPEIMPDGSLLVFCSSGRVKDDPPRSSICGAPHAGGLGRCPAAALCGRRRQHRRRTTPQPRSQDDLLLERSCDAGRVSAHPRAGGGLNLKRLEAYDNSNANVWSIPLPA